ncbi:lipopolysaccharide biosynthesis protein [Hathewaya massiliensis]|uniref:lipopolysaccharide biosynthesis protein n=1 Tax=Hathewaya massiliensis TaxID=1964382 RepID=UPI00115B26F6|nr:O-unit flippase [Hathewaya massiliensis]
MRVKHSRKNVIYGIVTYTLLMVLTFVNRKVFINILGQDMAGLQGLLQGVLNFLNLIESGVGMAIMFSLYKPFKEGDKVQIKSIVTLYSKIYRVCGTILFFSGIILSNFLYIFVKEQIDIRYVKVCFIIYIIDTTLTYYFSYKTCLLYASENGYLISFWDFIFKFLRGAIQIGILYIYKSFIVFILIQVVTNIGYLIIINYIVDKKFNWLKTTKTEEVKEKGNIIRNIKALFIHKIGSFVVFSTDNILIPYFFNFKTATMFTNYNLVIGFCQSFINKIFDGIAASIGNMLAEGNKKKSFEVFKKLFFFNFWISSFVGISLYNAIDKFIELWLGKGFILDRKVLIVLLINFYITTMRMCVDKFKESAGLYYEDRYAPIFEIIINLVFSIILAEKMGLVGIFLGTLISNLSVVFWIKPKIVFNNVFNKGLIEYLKYYIVYLFYAVVPFILTRFACNNLNVHNKLLNFLLNCILNVIIINLTYVILFYRNKEFKYYKDLLMKKVRNL